MRILFRNLGQAEFYLKACKKTLANSLIAPDGGRLPTQRIRNAFCRGLGYSSYDELKITMSRRHEFENSSLSLDDLRRAFAKGFSLALTIAEEYGFRLPEPADTLVIQLTEEVLQDWKK
ncbi:MAG TPA: hypothetical protein VF591_14365 [Pyrinomonadaceae bacterium]